MRIIFVLIVLSHLEMTMNEERDVFGEFENNSLADYSPRYEAQFYTLSSTITAAEDIRRTTSEIIRSRGFQSQEHTVLTDDGFILGIFRIINPYVNTRDRKKPVLLWHGIALNSNYWVISTPGQLDQSGRYSESSGLVKNNCHKKLTSNVAFTLAACGYDVWLGNTRGNRYSSGNLFYQPDSFQYNDYTFTEVGIYDVRNTVQYIMSTTNTSSIGYLGHSMGSTIMLALLSLIPSFEIHLKPIIFMPAVAFLGNTKQILFKLLASILQPLLNNLVINFSSSMMMSEDMAEICLSPFLKSICALMLQIFGGFSHLTTKETYVVANSVIANNISSKIVLQYGQFINTGRFNQFDYENPAQNILAYGQPTAPDYPLERITSRNLAIFVGRNDIIVSKKDIKILISSLRVPPLDVYHYKYQGYNHFDPQLSKYNKLYSNRRILKLLSRN